MKDINKDYFQQAKSWSDDIYLETIISRNRYRLALLWSLLMVSLLILSIVLLVPLRKTQLVLLHHADDGTVWAEPLQGEKPVINQAQIESDIVRYVTNRESYSAAAYEHHYGLVVLLSSREVSKQYQHEQSAENKNSPMNRFKNNIICSVKIQNILFLNKDTKHPLAQVNFEISEHNQLTDHEEHRALLSLISWQYRGTPKDPNSRWQNWNGFTVTHYSTQQRNL